MKTFQRAVAWVGIILLLGIYLVTFLLGIFGSEATKDMFMACLVCSVVIPCLMYAMLLIARILENKNNKADKPS